MPFVRPTTADPTPRWVGRAWKVGGVFVAVLALSVIVGWVSDLDGDYPKFRPVRDTSYVAERVLPPINSEVDTFDGAGKLGAVGDWPWKVVVGTEWTTKDGLAVPSGDGGVAVVDPDSAAVIVQADVFRPAQGSGIVFRWTNEANHFAIEFVGGSAPWLLVRTENGVRVELTKFGSGLRGANIRVTLTGTGFVVALNGRPQLVRSDRSLADGTAVGMIARDSDTRFDEFAVLVR